MQLEYVKPDEGLEAEVLRFRDSFYQSGERVINGSGGLDFFGSYSEWLENARAVEAGEREGLVPSRIRLVREVGGPLVGIVDIRPTLPAEKRGYGHIGYAVAPAFRRRGIASAILSWGTGMLRSAGVRQVLACCYEENRASRGVLEKGGFTLAESYTEPESGRTVRIYATAD